MSSPNQPRPEKTELEKASRLAAERGARSQLNAAKKFGPEIVKQTPWPGYAIAAALLAGAVMWYNKPKNHDFTRAVDPTTTQSSSQLQTQDLITSAAAKVQSNQSRGYNH